MRAGSVESVSEGVSDGNRSPIRAAQTRALLATHASDTWARDLPCSVVRRCIHPCWLSAGVNVTSPAERSFYNRNVVRGSRLCGLLYQPCFSCARSRRLKPKRCHGSTSRLPVVRLPLSKPASKILIRVALGRRRQRKQSFEDYGRLSALSNAGDVCVKPASRAPQVTLRSSRVSRCLATAPSQPPPARRPRGG
jgi:hypothetical protein